ncbi:HNH endonuclease [Pseudarthrobacter sp. YS3]|uniref:HNH endonuclease n=1 Tax=Pseudarthrobacter sp. YS3 TaxID=3453718 RepID=UPI003EEBE412
MELDEFPPYDGSIDIGIWKAQRAKAIKVARAKRSTMLSHVGADGAPLYRLTEGGNFQRTDPLSQTTRELVIERDGHACVSCSAAGPFEVDHIIRYVDGGSNDPGNLQTLCGPCHRIKGGR